MIILDTNYLLRFFTEDIKSQSLDAKRLIKGSQEIFIPTIVIAETVYFLKKHYLIKKDNVVYRLLALVRQPNILTVNFVHLAFEIYKEENLSFYDCLIIAEAIEKKSEIKSFDKKLLKAWERRKQIE